MELTGPMKCLGTGNEMLDLGQSLVLRQLVLGNWLLSCKTQISSLRSNSYWAVGDWLLKKETGIPFRCYVLNAHGGQTHIIQEAQGITFKLFEGISSEKSKLKCSIVKILKESLKECRTYNFPKSRGKNGGEKKPLQNLGQLKH